MKLRFDQLLLTFELTTKSETRIEGVLRLSEDEVSYIDAWEDENETWYLTAGGDRLPDEKLMDASPWSMKTEGREYKILQRFFDRQTGESWFSLAAPLQLTHTSSI